MRWATRDIRGAAGSLGDSGDVESRTFHRTADRRGLTQPMVSTRIKALAPYENTLTLVRVKVI
jgi:hypothetical protein